MAPRVIVIGAGFAGIGMAIRLLRDGCRELVVLERSDGVGGTWRANTYPGAGCDIPSHLYSFSFFPSARWSRTYAQQPEILAYLERCVEHFGLARHLRFDAEVTRAEFDDERGLWHVTLQTGETLEAEVVVSAVGQLNRPYSPELPGRDSFAGPAFHSACWDHDVELTGRRVGVVGTGASAIQLVPRIVEQAAHTVVFQRTPPYVVPKLDRPYRAWEQALYESVPGLLRASRGVKYALREARAYRFVRKPGAMARVEKKWRRGLAEAIPDPELVARLTPDYVLGCKRILLANDWYEAILGPKATLATDAVTEVRADGVVTADGTAWPLDVLVYATGFRASEFLVPMEVRGRGGRELNEDWRAGAEAYLGLAVSGFPNFFLLYGPNTNLGHNSILYMLESQIGYVAQAVAQLAAGRSRWFDVREDVQRRWNDRLQELSRGTVWETGCDSWYTTAAGRNTNNWPSFTFDYRRRVRRLELADYELAPT